MDVHLHHYYIHITLLPIPLVLLLVLALVPGYESVQGVLVQNLMVHV